MIRFSVPELNDLVGEALPNVGLTLIYGPAVSGKTLLMMDLVRNTLLDPDAAVTVFSDEPEKWRRNVQHHLMSAQYGGQLRIASGGQGLDSIDFKTDSLIVLDNMWPQAVDFMLHSSDKALLHSALGSVQGPQRSNRRKQQAAVAISTEREGNKIEVRLQKHRHKAYGEPVSVSFDPEGNLSRWEDRTRSRWDVLLGEDIL